MPLTPIGFEVLLSLVDGPQHGYGIKLAIEDRTRGDVRLGSGTLYQAIYRLEREGLISGERCKAPDPRRGRTYCLVPAGRQALDLHLRQLGRIVDYARAKRLLPAGKLS